MTVQDVRSRRFAAADVLDLRLLLVLAPGALLTSVLTRGPSGAGETIAWIMVNVASIAFVAISVLLVHATIRMVGCATLSPFVVVLIGAGLGLLKGVSTSGFGWVAGLTAGLFVEAEVWRWVSTVFQGAVLVPALALIRAALRRYRAEYERLITERARRALLAGDSPSGTRGARVVRFVTEARQRIDAAADPTVAIVLQELVEEHLRPLTRELWSVSEVATDFSPRSLLRAAIHAHSSPVIPVSLVFAFTAFVARTAYAPLGANILVSVFDVAAIHGVFALAGRVRTGGRRHRIVRLGATVAAATAAVMLGEAFILVDAEAPLGPVTATVVVFVWLLILTVLSRATAIAIRTSGTVRDELEQLLGEELDDAVAEASQRLRDRDLADRLHSQIQNRLISAARRIERSEGSGSVVREEVEAIGELLDEFISGSGRPAVDARTQIADLVARWAGFVTIETHLDTAADGLEEDVQARVAQAVAEAVNNAVRHGLAERITVAVTVTGASIRLVVEDDGVGPVVRPPGLGGRLFDALSQGEWSLRVRPDGGSRLEVTIDLD